jgi:hypothetical protein
MKKLSPHFQKFFMLILFTGMQMAIWAQGTNENVTEKTTSTTTTSTTEWYTSPWVWIAGAAVFIIILVALLRGNSSTSNTESRTTVIKDR